MKTIALGADYNFLNNAETTIKSILWHNREVKIYLFNFDIPQEWFVRVNQYINQFGSKIIDAKFDPAKLDELVVSKKGINRLSYARCFIPSVVTEDVVLYLDSDIIVAKPLDELFQKDFNGNKLLGVNDFSALPNFNLNTGVLLMNNKEIRKDPEIADKLLELGKNKDLNNGDQQVINEYFKDEIGEIAGKFNYQIGYDSFAYWNYRTDTHELIEKIHDPVIYHFLTSDKPYHFMSSSRGREIWWHYRLMEWSEIVNKWARLDFSKIHEPHYKKHVFILTNDARISHLEELVRNLPDVRFTIGAYTLMAPQLTNFVKYPNVKLREATTPWIVDEEVKKANVYLDINLGQKNIDILNQVTEQQKPILTFNNVKTEGFDNYFEVFNDDVNGMIRTISTLTDWYVLGEKISILSKKQSLNYVLKNHSSVVRLGDGELNLIEGRDISYQKYDPELSARLKELLMRGSDKQLAVGLPEISDKKLASLTPLARYYYEHDFFFSFLNLFKEVADKNNKYISTFISRPYMDLINKSKSADYFKKLKSLWQDRDLLIVEGKYTRSGEGNDLYDNSRSIKRIICPSHDAFSKINEIEAAIRENYQDRLVLLMLGPTSKVIVDDLLDLHQQLLDLGHIDSEYEWFKMGADHKVKLSDKHTAEFNYDENIELPDDEEFDEQICARIEG